MHTTTRRKFLSRASIAIAGLSAVACEPSAFAIEPFKRAGKSKLMLSLAAYSFRQYFKDGKEEYLFDLLTDQHEQADFREKNPAMFDELRSEFKKWDSTVLPRPPARVR